MISMNKEKLSLNILSDIIIYMKYARYNKKEQRRETWKEIVTRCKNMHIKKFPKLKNEIEEAFKYVYDKKVLPSMRSLQFAGKAIEKNPTRQYNCSALSMSNVDSFKELAFLLMSGTGAGISVQQKHVTQLPEIYKPKKSRRYLIGDSIEDWANSVGALIESYMGNRKSKPDFDFSDIREKGLPLKTSGGLAPGPQPLKDCLHNIEKVLDRKKDGEKLTSLETHDICCYIADMVVVGGSRRSSMLSMFSFNDTEVKECKFNTWYIDNPQRAMANNSALILRHKITEREFYKHFDTIRKSKSGEPSYMLSNCETTVTNPCAEISLETDPKYGTGSMCNLTEINTVDIITQEEFNKRAKVAAFIGTLQATYTNFHYLREQWKELVDKEALLGVSLTGIASGNILTLDMKEAAKEVLKENERTSELIGINKAYRTTTVKPSGTASLVLGCSSGIHVWHAEYYIRRIRVGKDEPIYSYLNTNHPELIEDDYFKPTTQAIISIPIKAPDGALTRKETALQLLERVKKVYRSWILTGHRKGNNTHNVSVTVSVKEYEWDKVGKWLWENKDSYTAISLLPYDDHTYVQAPFEEITKEKYEELLKELKKVNLTKIKENEDLTNLQGEVACGGNACEIT